VEAEVDSSVARTTSHAYKEAITRSAGPAVAARRRLGQRGRGAEAVGRRCSLLLPRSAAPAVAARRRRGGHRAEDEESKWCRDFFPLVEQGGRLFGISGVQNSNGEAGAARLPFWRGGRRSALAVSAFRNRSDGLSCRLFFLFSPFCERFSQVDLFGNISKNRL
jgi:hypothetical protein